MTKKDNLFKSGSLIFLFCFFFISMFVIQFLVPSLVDAQTANTSWPMFRQNPQHTGQRSATTLNEPEVPILNFDPINTGPGFITDITSSPSIGQDGLLYIGSLDKKFFAIDPTLGSIIGDFQTGNSITSSPAIGEDGNIYIGSWDSTIYVFKFNRNTGFELFNFFSSGDENFGHLFGTVVDGGLGSGFPMSGASVTVAGIGTRTDSQGNFFILNIPKGQQSVIVAAGGKCDNVFQADICGFQRSQDAGVRNLADFTIVDGELVCPTIPVPPVLCSFGLDEGSLEPRSVVGQGNIRTNEEVQPLLKTQNGVNSSPLIGFNNWIYWGSINNRFYGWDIDSKVIFFKELDDDIFTSAVQSFDGTVYIITLSGVLHAFTPDFTEITRSDLGDALFKADGEVTSSPAVGPDGSIYFGSTDGNLYAVQSDGQLKWKFPTRGTIVSSPAIDRNGIIYFGSGDGNLYAIEDLGVDKPNVKWDVFVGSEVTGSSPSIGSDGRIYIGVSGEFSKIIAIDREGTADWCLFTENGITSTPAIDSDGSIYVGSFDGKLYGIGNDVNAEIPSDSAKFRVKGKVTDSAGQAIEEVVIKFDIIIEETTDCRDTIFDKENITDGTGIFVFPSVPAGRYNISISHKDFEDKTFENVIVSEDMTFDEDTSDGVNNNIILKRRGEDIVDDDDDEVLELVTIKEITWKENDQTCFPLEIQFRAQIEPPTVNVDYLWSFGDRSDTSDEETPVHVYSEAGTFEVTLQVTIQDTNENDLMKIPTPIIVTEGPCVRFEPTSKKVLRNQPVFFNDLTKVSDGSLLDFRRWEFSYTGARLNSSRVSSMPTPILTFKRLGDHNVSLFVSQTDGKDGVAFGTITVVNELVP